jgi:hypothetical protein
MQWRKGDFTLKPVLVRDVVEKPTLMKGLTEEQQQAVVRLQGEIAFDLVHEATSLLDLTPQQLVDEYAACSW